MNKGGVTDAALVHALVRLLLWRGLFAERSVFGFEPGLVASVQQLGLVDARLAGMQA